MYTFFFYFFYVTAAAAVAAAAVVTAGTTAATAVTAWNLFLNALGFVRVQETKTIEIMDMR